MNPVLERIIIIFKEMSLARRVAWGMLVVVVIAFFTTLFIWMNKTPLKPAYTGLSKEDAAAVVEKLKETNQPYKLAGDGTTILVAQDSVYDVRIEMAREGIPKGSGVGFEIFDKTEFGTTEFVQKINKKRALQGELARTIQAFDEVENARVMIVLPKDSVFIEEVKKPSASILLELNRDPEKETVTAIAHLVASSVQDLTPKLVTIVDTAGRILFEGKSEAELARIEAQNLADAQYQYKIRFEENLSRRIQTMLERIVGKDKAIVRVTSEMDFSKHDMSEEIYDPFERGTEFIRSRKNMAENVQRDAQAGLPSSVNPVVPPDEELNSGGGTEVVKKNDDTVNFEISKRVRETRKPMATLTRVSVAAVVDGKYEFQTGDDGKTKKVYVPRSKSEIQKFRDIVVKAMGYNESRNDQVSMETFPFASIGELAQEQKLTGFKAIRQEYGQLIGNILLVIALFLLVIRPIIKTVRDIQATVEEEALPGPDELGMLEEDLEPKFIEMDAEEQIEYLNLMTEEDREEFIRNMTPAEKASYLESMPVVDKAKYYAEQDLDKTLNILKAWVSEGEEEEEE